MLDALPAMGLNRERPLGQQPMLAKCICTNCAGHLEFEEENAGESIPCPHCGFETTLELPGSKRRDPELAAWLRKQALRRRLVWVAGPIVVFGGAGYALYRWGVPWVEDVLPWADTTTKAVLALLLLCLGTLGLLTRRGKDDHPRS